MSDPEGKSYQRQYDDSYASLIQAEMSLNKLKKLDGVKAAQYRNKIEAMQLKLAELEPLLGQERLSENCKNHLKQMYARLKYNKKTASEHAVQKYMAKGREMEAASAALVCQLDGIEYKTNKYRIGNGYVLGTPDMYFGDSLDEAQYVIDIKTSWDIGTFYRNMDSELPTAYKWQVMAYMWLTGAPAGEVSFCLVNTPEWLIEEELKHLMRKRGVRSKKDPWVKEMAADLRHSLTFDDMPPQERRIRREVVRDEAAIEKMAQKIELCRQYLVSLDEIFMNFFYSNTYTTSL
jgi:hypothetical protein